MESVAGTPIFFRRVAQVRLGVGGVNLENLHISATCSFFFTNSVAVSNVKHFLHLILRE